MTCEQISPERWRLSFSEAEGAFIVNVLARLRAHYADDPARWTPVLRAYWQGSISAGGKTLAADLEDAQELLAETRTELRSERLALAENWIRDFELAEKRHPWVVEISAAEREEFVAMLNDRRLTLALELGISDAEMEGDPARIADEGRRSSILEIDVLGHFILVTLGPQIHHPMSADLASAFNRADFDGYIFDCDGTLADSMPLHYRAWSESLADKLGRPAVEFTEDLFYHFGGMPARHIVERLNRDFGYNLPVETTAHEKEMHFVSMMHHGLKPVPEVVAVLCTLTPPAKVVVASGGLTGIVEDTLRHVGLGFGPGEIIQRVIGSDQVKLGKPHPDLFLRAAEVLGVPPARCLVFEDAAPGFQAATAAGMKYIDVRPFRADIHRAARY